MQRHMKIISMRYMKTLYTLWSPVTYISNWKSYIFNNIRIKITNCSFSYSQYSFSVLTSLTARSAAASLNIYAALCCCIPAVSLCVALCVLSYSLCCAPLLSIRQSTHGTDPTSSWQPPLSHCRCTDLTMSLTVCSIPFSQIWDVHHMEKHLFNCCIGTLLLSLFPTLTHIHLVCLQCVMLEKRREICRRGTGRLINQQALN